METPEEKRLRQNENATRWRKNNPEKHREFVKRWRENNPDKVAADNRKPRVRIYDPVKTKAWREKRLEDPDYRKKQNKLANDRATKIRRWLDEYKVVRGCVDCGYNAHAVALDFDHIGDDKTINVCFAKSLAQAKREIEKCEIRCSNCHRVKTAERRQQARKSKEILVL